MVLKNFPPNNLLNPTKNLEKDFNLIILWILANNEMSTWKDFISKPIKINPSTLSAYLKELLKHQLVEKHKRGVYMITRVGREQFLKLSKQKINEIEGLNYPSDAKIKRYDYKETIIWMLFNNKSCKWSDFLLPPLSINHSSLSKSIQFLLSKGYIDKKDHSYFISEPGIQHYEENQTKSSFSTSSLIEEQIHQIQKKNMEIQIFCKKFKVIDTSVKSSLIENILFFEYSKIENFCEKDDYFKLMLYLTINHPQFYHYSVSKDKFCQLYELEKKLLDFLLLNILEKNKIYPCSFFQIQTKSKIELIFRENDKFEKILRTLFEEAMKEILFQKLSETNFISQFSQNDLNFLRKKILDQLIDKFISEKLEPEFSKFLICYISYQQKKKNQTIAHLNQNMIQQIIWYTFPKNTSLESPSKDFRQKFNNECANSLFCQEIYLLSDLYWINEIEIIFSDEIILLWSSTELKDLIEQIKFYFEYEKYLEIELLLSNNLLFDEEIKAILYYLLDLRKGTISENSLYDFKTIKNEKYFILWKIIEVFLSISENDYKAGKKAIEELHSTEVKNYLIIDLLEIQFFYSFGREKEANQLFNKKIDPTYPKFEKKFISRIYLLLNLFNKRDRYQVINEINEHVKYGSSNLELSISFGILLANQNKHFQAIKHIQSISELNFFILRPKYYRIYLFLNIIWNYAIFKQAIAEKFFQKLKKEGGNKFYISFITFFQKMFHQYFSDSKHTITNKELFQKFEFLSSERNFGIKKSILCFYFARYLIKLKNYSNAIRINEKGLGFNKRFIPLIEQKIYILRTLEFYPNIFKFLDNLMITQPDRASDYWNLFYIKFFVQLKEFERGLKFCKDFEKRHSTDVLFHNAKIDLLIGLKRYREALKMIESLVEEYPNNSAVFDTMGDIYDKLEMKSEATDSYEHSIRLKKHSYETYIKLGDIYDSLGEIKLANSYYKKGIENFNTYGYITENRLISSAQKKLEYEPIFEN